MAYVYEINKFTGRMMFAKYDENNDRVYTRDTETGHQMWFGYNNNHEIDYVKSSDGLQIWYGKNGNTIHEIMTTGREAWYDDNGNCIREIFPNGSEIRYHKNGQMKYMCDITDGSTFWYTRSGKIIKAITEGKTYTRNIFGKYRECRS